MIKIGSILIDVDGTEEIKEYFNNTARAIRVNFDELDNQIRSIIVEYSADKVPIDTGQLISSSSRKFIESDGKSQFTSITRWTAIDSDGFNYALTQEEDPYKHTYQPDPGETTVAEYGYKTYMGTYQKIEQLILEYIRKHMGG